MITTRARAIITSAVASFGLIAGKIVASLITDASSETQLLITAVQFSIVAIILVLGTFWTIYYQANRRFFFAGVLYPTLALLPFWGLVEVLLTLLQEQFSPSVSAVLASVLVGGIIYILILTVNLLNASRLKNIPLGQAAKAVHFIITLVSTFVLLNFVYNSGLTLLLRLIIIAAYVGYHCYSQVALSHVIKREQSTLLVFLIVSTLFTNLLLSLWPLDALFSSVIASIVFYLLLNIFLEVREIVTRYIIFEYMLMLGLVIFLLLFNSSWGMFGSIF